MRFLSGGERNRVLLARLFAKPANVIVLDEPTNDLDAETLEMLEERLVELRFTVDVDGKDTDIATASSEVAPCSWWVKAVVVSP